MTIVRPAVAADLDAVSSLERALFGPDAWSPRSLEQELAAPGEGRVMLAALAGTRLLGYAALSYTDETGDLLRVAVNSAQHRQGIASRLCAEIFALAARQGCTRVVLEVAADNAPALALYRRLGFAEIHRRPRYYANGAAAVVMQLQLAGPECRRGAPISDRSKGHVRPLEGPYPPARREGG
jgi:ribosomal-protein-alanine N-acetyltransferase